MTAAPVAGSVLVPGTHVSMVPPPGFQPSTTFQGFGLVTSQASIVVAEMPTSYGTLVAGLTDDGLASRGVTVSTRTDLRIDGRTSTLIEGRQQDPAGDFGKVVLITGTDTLVAMITGNYPATDAPTGAAIRAAILTTTLDPTRSTDAQGALSFDVTPAAPLKFAGVVSGSAAYNTSGRLPSANPDEPLMIIAPDVSGSGLGDPAEAARSVLKQITSVTGAKVDTTTSVTIAGLPGARLLGTASRAKRPGEVLVYVVVVGDATGFVSMVGLCAPADRAACIKAFDSTANSYRPKG